MNVYLTKCRPGEASRLWLSVEFTVEVVRRASRDAWWGAPDDVERPWYIGGRAGEAVLSIRLRNQLVRQVHNSRCHFHTRPIITSMDHLSCVEGGIWGRLILLLLPNPNGLVHTAPAKLGRLDADSKPQANTTLLRIYSIPTDTFQKDSTM